ncbi:MAG: hypothetical protein AAF907_06705 [Planctomycetota bacterium]
MSDPAGGASDRTRYQVVRAAATDLVEQLGPLIRVGAALFPLAPTDQSPCRDGGEVMAVGDVEPAEQPARRSIEGRQFRPRSVSLPNGNDQQIAAHVMGRFRGGKRLQNGGQGHGDGRDREPENRDYGRAGRRRSPKTADLPTAWRIRDGRFSIA